MFNQDVNEAVKSWVALVPILTGTAFLLGIVHTLGFFYAIDIRFLSLFTLSEHALFALEAVPEVFVISFFLGLLFLGLSKGGLKTTSRQNMSSAGLNRPRSAIIFRSLSIAAVAAMFVYLGAYLAAAFIFAFGVANFFLSAHSTSEYFNAVLSALVLIFMSLSLGYEFGRIEIKKAKTTIHEIVLQSRSALSGRIVLTGSQGILFIDPEGQPTFRRWDGVIQIVRGKSRPAPMANEY